MIYNRKYATATGTGTHICVPLLKAGSDDFAQSGDWTPANGDVQISIDGGAFFHVEASGGTLPAPITGGLWQFTFTAAQMTGKSIRVLIQDASVKAVQDDGFVVETFGHASAMYPDDASIASTTTPANFSALLITAGGLVEQTQASADKAWATSARSLTTFGTLVADVTTSVWANSVRSLTTFGTLVADTVTAVWAAGTRTLTAIVDSAGVTHLLSVFTDARAAKIDNLNGTITGVPAAVLTAAAAAPIASNVKSIRDVPLGVGDGVTTPFTP